MPPPRSWLDPVLPLRRQVLGSGSFLAARQIAGLAIGVLGTVLLTRALGPSNYGAYGGALSLVSFMSTTGKLGTNVYLVRQSGSADREACDHASSILVFSSVLVFGVGLALAPALRVWIRDDRLVRAYLALLAVIPLNVLSTPAIALLERALAFRGLVVLEVVGQIALYAVALPLAWKGFSYWGPVIGAVVAGTIHFVGTALLARYRPRFRWSRRAFSELLSFGARYTLSDWLWQARVLINPLIVGRFAGGAGVGIVALTVRLCEALGVVGNSMYRLMISTLSRLQTEPEQLRRALHDAMVALLLLVGAPLALFAVAARWIVPTALGHSWAPALPLFPYVAVGLLVSATFSTHGALLYVVGRPGRVGQFNFAYLLLRVLGSLAFVPLLGVVGYGLGEVSALAAYGLLRQYANAVTPVSYARLLPWALALAPAMFVPAVPPSVAPALLVPAAALALVYGRRVYAGSRARRTAP